ncbi:SWIM zinc finger family protein [Caldivirga sp.]|uniref:SWIM zinc finger family protein n=1 Tax=Caldivirga sp. TaxID=2080243 RepID=UPI003D121D88
MAKDVVVTEAFHSRGMWLVRGLVKSRSQPDKWHSVVVRMARRGNSLIIEAKCDCEAFKYGLACWHVIHLVNVFRRSLKSSHVKGLNS